MARHLVGCAALLLAGCAESQSRWQSTLSTPGLERVVLGSERGTVRYDGRGAPDAVDVTVTSWARDASRARADREVAANGWEIVVEEGVLTAEGDAATRSAGVDLDLTGPAEVDADLLAYDGAVELYNVRGTHIATGDSVYAEDVYGIVDLFAGRDGLEAEVFPDPATESLLQAYGGDLILRIPAEGDYTLEVFADPAFGVSLQGVAFEETYVYPDYLWAVNGTGETYLQVIVAGGGFYLFAAEEGSTSD